MSTPGQSRASLLIKAAATAAIIVAAKLLFGASRTPERRPRHESGRGRAIDDGLHSKRTDLITYGVGYVLALGLTCAAFTLVHWRWATGTTALGIVLGLALVQAIVHFRCFLHVDLGRSGRDDLQLILFSTLIIAVMVGGTLVVLFNLRMRMM